MSRLISIPDDMKKAAEKLADMSDAEQAEFIMCFFDACEQWEDTDNVRLAIESQMDGVRERLEEKYLEYLKTLNF